MDARDIIAPAATIAFTVCGFYWIVAQRQRFYRRRAKESHEGASPSPWQRLSPREKLVRRLVGVTLGVAVAVLLRAAAMVVMSALSL